MTNNKINAQKKLPSTISELDMLLELPKYKNFFSRPFTKYVFFKVLGMDSYKTGWAYSGPTFGKLVAESIIKELPENGRDRLYVLDYARLDEYMCGHHLSREISVYWMPPNIKKTIRLVSMIEIYAAMRRLKNPISNNSFSKAMRKLLLPDILSYEIFETLEAKAIMKFNSSRDNFKNVDIDWKRFQDFIWDHEFLDKVFEIKKGRVIIS